MEKRLSKEIVLRIADLEREKALLMEIVYLVAKHDEHVQRNSTAVDGWQEIHDKLWQLPLSLREEMEQ